MCLEVDDKVIDLLRELKAAKEQLKSWTAGPMQLTTQEGCDVLASRIARLEREAKTLGYYGKPAAAEPGEQVRLMHSVHRSKVG